MLRQLLWPTRMDSCAMKYGSINEKVALRRFKEYVVQCLPHASDLPFCTECGGHDQPPTAFGFPCR